MKKDSFAGRWTVKPFHSAVGILVNVRADPIALTKLLTVIGLVCPFSQIKRPMANVPFRYDPTYDGLLISHSLKVNQINDEWSYDGQEEPAFSAFKL